MIVVRSAAFAIVSALWLLPSPLQAAGPAALPDTQLDAPELSSAAEVAASVRVPPGFRVELFAAEPDVRQPIAMTSDTRGRLWIAENYTYAESAVFHDESLTDRIIILDDTDGDGRAERRTVFWDQAHELTSVELGHGGVWAMCPPRLLFLPDRDGDDRPDGPAEVVLEGFDVARVNHHNFANGLKWGPDGWLYGRNGITHVGRVGTPATPPNERTIVGPGMWRFHPVTHRFEVVATGTTNPWGHDWDEYGELFFINTVIGHLWHVVPGAHFKRMFGADPNPYVYELIDQTADHYHWDTRERWQDIRAGMSDTTAQAGGGHAHSGLLIYQGDNWPAEFRGHVFTVNLHGRRLNCDHLERSGSGYVAHHGDDCFFWSDPWFRGIDLATAPDGGVWVLDWTDVGECHENDGVHRNSGRVFKLIHGQPAPRQLGDLRRLEDAELVTLQTHANDWFARQARLILAERAQAGADLASAHTALSRLLHESAATPHRLRALWGLYVSRGLPESSLVALLADRDEHVRAWAVRLLVDNGAPSSTAIDALRARAAGENSGLVLSYLASSLQKLPPEACLDLAAELTAQRRWSDDRALPLLIWYGVEAAVPQRPAQAVALAARSQLDVVSRFIARRLTQDIAAHPDAVEQLVAAIAAEPATEHCAELIAGMAAALRGVRQAQAPPSWAALQPRLTASDNPQLQSWAREIAVVFGDGVAVDDLMRLAASGEADVETRRAAIRSLALARAPGALEILSGLIVDLDLGADAIRGLREFDDPSVAALLVKNYDRLPPPARSAAIEALVARAAFATVLIEAVRAGAIPREDLAVDQIRQLQQVAPESLVATLAEIWPELRPIAADKREQIAAWKAALQPDALAVADRSAGRAVWEKSCAKCHTLFGAGARVGPDLTGAQRGNLDYLLENIVDPSASLAPSFRVSTLVLTDGRVVTGVILSQTDAGWEIQTAGERLTLAAADVEESAPTTRSLMPEGLLDLLTAAEVRDLVAYIMSPGQVDLPAAGR